MPKYGRLCVKGASLVDHDGRKVLLRGVSSHGLQWYPQFINKPAIEELRDRWSCDVVRLAMYVEEGGYTEDGRLDGASYKTMLRGIQAAIDADVYVIVDWHVCNSDQTPRKHWGEARTFFDSIAIRFGNSPNIIYEICNEPNNAGNDYLSQIADYADDMIRTIRAHAPDAVVIIGSGQWSKECVDAWQTDKETRQGEWHRTNVMYTLHRYCDRDFQSWSPAIRAASLAGCPIFATECGPSDSAETAWDRQAEFHQTVSLYEELGISWCVWSLCDKREPSALLAPGAPPLPPWGDSQLSGAGILTQTIMRAAAEKPAPAPSPAPEPVCDGPRPFKADCVWKDGQFIITPIKT